MSARSAFDGGNFVGSWALLATDKAVDQRLLRPCYFLENHFPFRSHFPTANVLLEEYPQID